MLARSTRRPLAWPGDSGRFGWLFASRPRACPTRLCSLELMQLRCITEPISTAIVRSLCAELTSRLGELTHIAIRLQRHRGASIFAKMPSSDPASAPVRTDRTHAERAAAWLSLGCAVHCLVFPVAMSITPALGFAGASFEGPTEAVLTILVVVSSLLGGYWGYRRHRDVRMVLAASLGLASYLVGHALDGSWVGLTLSVGGALLLAASSFLGARMMHDCAPTCAH